MENRDTARLRTLLLLVLLFGMAGTLIELLLLEHTEDWEQWIPIVSLGAGMTCGLLVLGRPNQWFVRLFRLVMTAFVVVGGVGLWLHYSGNAEFEIERAPTIAGWALFRESLMGATPALAPGTMIWFGLIGLGLTWAHPALRR